MSYHTSKTIYVATYVHMIIKLHTYVCTYKEKFNFPSYVAGLMETIKANKTQSRNKQ